MSSKPTSNQNRPWNQQNIRRDSQYALLHGQSCFCSWVDKVAAVVSRFILTSELWRELSCLPSCCWAPDRCSINICWMSKRTELSLGWKSPGWQKQSHSTQSATAICSSIYLSPLRRPVIFIIQLPDTSRKSETGWTFFAYLNVGKLTHLSEFLQPSSVKWVQWFLTPEDTFFNEFNLVFIECQARC